MRLGAGERGGLYYAFAGLLAAAGGDRRCGSSRVTTAGSRENLDLLAAGDVDAALTLADSVRPDDDVDCASAGSTRTTCNWWCARAARSAPSPTCVGGG